MDLNYTPEDVAYRKQVRAWLEENMPREEVRDARRPARPGIASSTRPAISGMGWPKEYGGQDARPMEQAIVADEMARANAPAPDQRPRPRHRRARPSSSTAPTRRSARYLRKILTAEEMWCQLYSEPNAGSDLAALKTSAVDAGDQFVVNGQKIWTSGGAIADWGLLLARTDPEVPKHKGISCFLMDMRQPGVDVRPLKQITGSSEFCEVFMTNVRVEKADQIGKLGEGWAHRPDHARLRARRPRAGARHHATRRSTTGWSRRPRRLKRNGRPLIDDPLVRQKLGAHLGRHRGASATARCAS